MNRDITAAAVYLFTAGNFSAKNYKLSSHDSFLMTQENVYDENEEILVVSKHYIPAEVFELKFSI